MTPSDDDLYLALAHPLRREIVKVLLFTREDALSPRELAPLLGKPGYAVNYHVKALRECGAALLIRTEPSRGSVKHYYRAAPVLNEAAWVSAALDGGAVAAVRLFERELTDERLSRLSSIEAQVLRLRFALEGGPGHSCRQIAEIVGVSPRRVREVQTDALRKVRLENA